MPLLGYFLDIMRVGKLQMRDPQANVERINDNTPGEIQYSTGWNFNQHVNQNETSHSTGIPGSYMFVIFQGTQVNVTGTIPAGDAPLAANYIFDNGQTFMASVPAASQDVIHQTLFASPILQDGPHNLTVQVVQTGLGRNYTFQNFMVLTSNGGSVSASSISLPGSTESVHDGGHTSQPSTETPTAVIGGLTALVIVFLFILLSSLLLKKGVLSKVRSMFRRDPIGKESASEALAQRRAILSMTNTSIQSYWIIPEINPFILPEQQAEQVSRSNTVQSVSTDLPSYATLDGPGERILGASASYGPSSTPCVEDPSRVNEKVH
ncbi:hypothetical protein ACEPAF_1254 [Sanghuangporus sanghuang]